MQNTKTHFMSDTIFRDNLKKYSTAKQATDDTTQHATKKNMRFARRVIKTTIQTLGHNAYYLFSAG